MLMVFFKVLKFIIESRQAIPLQTSQKLHNFSLQSMRNWDRQPLSHQNQGNNVTDKCVV